MDELLDNVDNASAYFEGKDRRSPKGDVSGIRKTKLLVGGRFNKSGGATNTEGVPHSDQLTERDTVILASAPVGRGASRRHITKCYRVVDIHDKHYNKWFTSKVSTKKWQKDSKFKL